MQTNVIGLGYIGFPTALMMAANGLVDAITPIVIMVGHKYIVKNIDKLSNKVIFDTRNVCELQNVYKL